MPEPSKAPEPTKAPYDVNAAVTGFMSNLPAGYYGIKNTDALKALTADPKPMLIDLREPKEITQTIDSAVNIPIRSLLQNLDKLPAKDATILVYCGIGHRGGIATTLLQMLGYKNAKSVSGGFSGWKAASLPIIDSAPVEPKASGVKVDVDQDLLAALDAWLVTMPDDFWGAPPASAAKAFAADPKPFIVDVRTAQEILAAGAIEGSVNIVLPELVKNLDKLPADKNAPIYTYCAVGHRGSIALTALRLLGYTDVKSISGGFNNWVKAGLPKVGGFDATKLVPDFVAAIPDGYYGMKNTDALKALAARDDYADHRRRGQHSGARVAEELGQAARQGSAHPRVLRHRPSRRHCDGGPANAGLHRRQEHQRRLQRLEDGQPPDRGRRPR